MHYDFFISYCTKDDKRLPRSLYDTLVNDYKLKVFFSEKVLNPADNYQTIINEALHNSTIGVVLLSEEYKKSSQCEDERDILSRKSRLYPIVREKDFEKIRRMYSDLTNKIHVEKYSVRNNYSQIAVRLVGAFVNELKIQQTEYK